MTIQRRFRLLFSGNPVPRTGRQKETFHVRGPLAFGRRPQSKAGLFEPGRLLTGRYCFQGTLPPPHADKTKSFLSPVTTQPDQGFRPAKRLYMRLAGYLTALFLLFSPVIFFPVVKTSHASSDSIRVTPVVRAVNNVKTSVVNISTFEQVFERKNPFSSFGRDPFFDRFFNDFLDNSYNKKSVRTHLGSGVIINSEGYVITNWHVVERASTITVTTLDEKEFHVDLVGADPKSDIAVLKIKSRSDFPGVAMGDSDNLLIGETVIAIGNPFGLSHTVTTGVVSAINRSIKTDNQVYDNFIQTDASINPGNSGGPLLNIMGELIGINTAIYGDAQGIGFAIPVNAVKRIVDDLVQYGEVRPPWLGMSVQDLDAAIATQFGYSSSDGVIISDILPDSPAEKSGLRRADILISIDKKKIKSKESFERILHLYTADTTLKIGIFRQGAFKTYDVKASEFPLSYVDTFLWDVLGLNLMSNSTALAQRYGLHTASGVVISRINPQSQAFNKGLEPGDVIVRFLGSPIHDIRDFKKRLAKNIHRDSVVLLVQRGRYGYYITFEM